MRPCLQLSMVHIKKHTLSAGVIGFWIGSVDFVGVGVDCGVDGVWVCEAVCDDLGLQRRPPSQRFR